MGINTVHEIKNYLIVYMKLNSIQIIETKTP